jgi:hypothetical protein
MLAEFFCKVVLPILGPAKTSFIGISTAQNMSNFFMRLLNMRDPKTRRPAFKGFNFVMACDECLKAKLAATCTHMEHMLPHYLVGSKQRMIKSVYEELSMDKLMAQEMVGVGQAEYQSAFPSIYVKAVFDWGVNPFASSPNRKGLDVWTFIDPTGNGKQSDFCIVSAIFDQGKMIIVGAESIPDRSQDYDQGLPSQQYLPYVVKHFADVRRLPSFGDCVFVIAVESNMGAQNDIIYKIKKDVRQSILLDKTGFYISHLRAHGSSGGTGGGGVQSTPFVKEGMYRYTLEMLAAGGLSFHKDMVVNFVPKPHMNQEEVRSHLLKNMETQFDHYAKLVKETNANNRSWNDNTADIHYTYGGKHSGGKDDLVVGVMGAKYMHVHYCVKEGFKEACHTASILR